MPLITLIELKGNEDNWPRNLTRTEIFNEEVVNAGARIVKVSCGAFASDALLSCSILLLFLSNIYSR